MKIEKIELPGIYQAQLDNCYSEIKKTLEAIDMQFYIRQESSIVRNMTMYFIEVSAPDTLDSDDYGVVVDVSLEDNLENVICNIDVLRATGYLYFQKIVEMKVNGNYVNQDNLNESLDYIKSLPKLVVENFKRDYSNV